MEGNEEALRIRRVGMVLLFGSKGRGLVFDDLVFVIRIVIFFFVTKVKLTFGREEMVRL